MLTFKWQENLDSIWGIKVNLKVRHFNLTVKKTVSNFWVKKWSLHPVLFSCVDISLSFSIFFMLIFLVSFSLGDKCLKWALLESERRPSHFTQFFYDHKFRFSNQRTNDSLCSKIYMWACIMPGGFEKAPVQRKVVCQSHNSMEAT